jgi:hypothetical protein
MFGRLLFHLLVVVVFMFFLLTISLDFHGCTHYPINHVFPCFVKFKCLVENFFSTKIKQFQRDGGGEFISKNFQSFFSHHGIFHRITCPYTSQQNGIAERKRRHIVETELSLHAHSHLPSTYWVEAFSTAIYLINRLPTPTLKWSVPYTLLFNKAPDFSQLRVFGCACYPLRPYNRHKPEFRSKKCIFLGYSSNKKGYRCLDPSSHRVYISRHVVFDEKVFHTQDGALLTMSFGGSLPQVAPPSGTFLYPHLFFPSPPTSSHVSEQHPVCPIVPALVTSSSHEPPATGQPPPHEPSPPNAPCDTSSHHTAPAPLPSTNPDSSPHVSSPAPSVPATLPSNGSLSSSTTVPAAPSSPANRVLTRSQTGSLKPKTFPDYHLFYSTKHPFKALHSMTLPPKPSCYSMAASNPHWRAAMGSEFDAFMSTGTWSLCPCPLHKNVIWNK